MSIAEIDGQLSFHFPFQEIKVPLCTELRAEGYTVGSLGGGGDMTGTIGSRLHDMHHTASAFGIAADIERICSHQYAAHRIDAHVKFHLCH